PEVPGHAPRLPTDVPAPTPSAGSPATDRPPVRPSLAPALPHPAGRRRLRRLGRSARPDGPLRRTPGSPRPPRRRRHLPGHLPGALRQSRLDPAARVPRQLAVRGRLPTGCPCQIASRPAATTRTASRIPETLGADHDAGLAGAGRGAGRGACPTEGN